MCWNSIHKKVFIEEIVNFLLPMKLERYKLTEEEYRRLRRSGVTDNDLENIFLSGKKVNSSPKQ